MIISSQWQDFFSRQLWLILTAYSFSERELDSIPRVLSRSGIVRKQIENLSKDEAGRMARQFRLDPEGTESLEKWLDVRFLADRKGDVVIIPGWIFRDEASPIGAVVDRFGRWLLSGKEQPYCCRELGLHGDGKESFQITADDDDDALFKCALMGGQRHWFGSKANRGPCLTLKRRKHTV